MAGIREIRAIGPSAQLSDVRAAAQRTVNLYLVATESPGEDKQFILRPSTGGTSEVTCSGELRGMCGDPYGTFLYFVDGNTVKRRSSLTGSILSLTGTLSGTTGAVSMAYGSDDKILIVGDVGGGYVVSGSTVTLISDADFPAAAQAAYLDGYWLVRSTSDQFFISAIDDPTSWNALDFSSADRLPDRLQAIRVTKQEIYLFGANSTEIWYNSGNADFPFARYTQAPIDIGIYGPYAVCNTTDSLAFVGQASNGVPMVYLFNGHTPRRISNRAVEEALGRLYFAAAGSGDLRMWSYQIAGSEFIGIDLPSPDVDDAAFNSTWVYDISTGQWHERQALKGSTYQQLEALDVVTHEGDPFMGLRYWVDGSTSSWRIFRLSDGSNTWGDQTLRVERTWPHLVAPSNEAVRYSSLEIVCTSGTSGDTVTLEVSNDGGQTFGTPASKTLDQSRVRWYFLGSARDRVFRLRSTKGITLYSAQVEAG